MSASPAVVVPQDGEKQLTSWSKSAELCDDLPSNNLDKETARLGDDTTMKVRKPYTITKQRERWTEEEHERFLEALKLYGRAWRQIEEHVGTKTAVQIRSHAQKFFSKLEREGSLSSSKGPISDFDIPPPRPKRKPAHPYPRKPSGKKRFLSVVIYRSGDDSLKHSLQGIVLNSSAHTQLKSPQTLESNLPGCEVSPNEDAAMEANKSPASSIPETSDQHPLNTVSEKITSVNFCQQPRKRGTEEVQSEASPNESQETTKLFRSTCAEPELSHAPEVAALQPNSLFPPNNIFPIGIYGPHMALPYFHPMHSLAAFPNAALLLNSVPKIPCQSQKPGNIPDLASLAAAHAQLRNTLMPWLNQNPIAIAACTAATTPWIGLGPPPLHLLPLGPPSDRLNSESPSAAEVAITAAAAASLADASAWLAIHRAFTHPPNAPEVRPLFKPNPVLQHSAITEGQQQQGLTNSSEGSKNGVTVNVQTSSEEHDVSTAEGIQETTAHTDHPNPITDDHSVPPEHSQSNFCRYEVENSKKQENKGHSRSDLSYNVKKERRRNGFSGMSGNGLLVESKNGLQKSACISMNGKMLGRTRTNVSSDHVDFSPSMYQGSNSISPDEANGEGCAFTCKSSDSLVRDGCAYKGKSNGSLDDFTTSAHVIDCTLEEQSGSSAGKNKDCMASYNIANMTNKEIRVEIDASMQHENGFSHKRLEDMVSKARQCMSSCGSTEDKKDKVNSAPLKIENAQVRECGANHDIDDSGSESIPCEKAGKFLVQACLKRWQGGKIMLTHTCTNMKSASESVCGNCKDKDPESMVAIGLINGNKQGLSLIKAHQSLKGSKASSSGSSKYTGHGFVPYRRD